MTTRKWEAPVSAALFKALSNPKRVTILLYLNACRFATNKVIAKYTGIPQPQTSAALKQLLVTELVTKEKVRTQWLYMLNESTWNQVEHLLV